MPLQWRKYQKRFLMLIPIGEKVWTLNPGLLPMSFPKAVSSMADMQALRGVIYDICRLGLLSQPGTSPATLRGAIQGPSGDKPDRL